MFGGNSIVLTVFLLINVFILGIVLTFAYTHFRAHRTHEKEPPKKLDMPVLPHDVQQRIIQDAENDYESVIKKSTEAFEKDLESTSSSLSEELSKIGHDIMSVEMDRYKASLAQLNDEAVKQLGGSEAGIEQHQQSLRKQLADKQAEMDATLQEHQHELQVALAERSSAIEHELQELQANYAKKQTELEATLSERETELIATLKQRETELAEHQTELEAELVGRQQAFAAKQTALEQKLEQEMATRRERYIKQLDTKLSESVIALLTDTLGQQVDLGAQTTYLVGVLEQHKAELIQGITDEA